MKTKSLSATFAYFLSLTALGLFTSILGPTLPGLAEHTSSQLGEIGFLFTARALGYLLGSLTSGQLFDRRGGNSLLALILLGMGAALGLAPLIDRLWLLAGVMVLLGLAEGALDIGANLLLLWTHARNPGPFLNALHFFFGAGALVGPIIAGQVMLRTGDIHWAYWLIALVPLPIAAWLVQSPSPAPPARLSAVAQRPAAPALLIGIVVLFFLYVGGEASFGGWIYTYLMTLDLGNPAQAALLTSAFWGALTAGRLLSIPMAVRFRPAQLILGDVLLCLASLGVTGLWPASALATWIGALGLGLGMASIFPSALAFAEQHMTLHGRITRWFFVGTGAGGMLLPWLVGFLFERLGPQVLIYALLVDFAAALVVLALCYRLARSLASHPAISPAPLG